MKQIDPVLLTLEWYTRELKYRWRNGVLLNPRTYKMNMTGWYKMFPCVREAEEKNTERES